MIRRWFLSHPSSVNESYFEHMEVASGFGVALLGAGLACLVHAVVPCLFERTGSRTIAALHQRLVIGRASRAARDGVVQG